MKFLPLIIVLTLLPAVTYAVNVGFLKDSVLSRLDKDELESFRMTVNQTLNASPDQEVILWHSDTTELKGRVKARYSYSTDGIACRHMVLELTDEKRARDLYNIDICRQDQTWTLVSTPGAEFTRQDWDSFAQELQTGLDNDADGQSRQWASNKKKLNAVFKFESTETASDRICRHTAISVTSESGSRSTGDYVFCKVDRDWKRDVALEQQD